MFKLLRLDERLIHGQVAFAWTNSLSADCILVANDGVAKDKLRATSLKLAAPAEVKFVVKSVEDAIKALNGHKTDKYKLFILVDNTKDALALVSAVEEVDHVNLGNMKVKEGTKTWTPSVSVTAEDVENIKGMIEHGAEVECRAVPTDKKVMAERCVSIRKQRFCRRILAYKARRAPPQATKAWGAALCTFSIQNSGAELHTP